MSGFFEEDTGEEKLEEFLHWYYEHTLRTEYNLEDVLSYLDLSRVRLAQWGYTRRARFDAQQLYEATLRYTRKRLEIEKLQVCIYHDT